MKNKKVYIIIFSLLCIYLSLYCFNNYKSSTSAKAYTNGNLIRLHVIAESNAPYDQYLKRIVRNYVIDYFKKNKVKKENITELEKIIKNKLTELNYNKNIEIEFGNYYFPGRTYNNLTLKAANYQALKVKIANFKGSNWWCVLSPELCLVKDYNTPSLFENDEIEYKFKFIEFYNNLKKKRLKFSSIFN
ncbi:MAG: stage II sporulation protein R [Bacillota bacterium]